MQQNLNRNYLQCNYVETFRIGHRRSGPRLNSASEQFDRTAFFQDKSSTRMNAMNKSILVAALLATTLVACGEDKKPVPAAAPARSPPG